MTRKNELIGDITIIRNMYLKTKNTKVRVALDHLEIILKGAVEDYRSPGVR